MPVSLDKLADVPRFVYRDSFMTKCDDKSSYDMLQVKVSDILRFPDDSGFFI